MNKNKGFIGIGLIIAIVLGIAVVGGGAYYLGKNKGENNIIKENPIDNLSPKDVSIANWKTYTNKEYGFELKYPNDWKFSTSFSNADGFFFTENKSQNGFTLAVLPKGEFDHGYSGEPFISDTQIDGKNVKESKWNDSTSYQFTDSTTPSTWIKCGLDLKNCNRIEIQGYDQSDLELIDQILATFKFTN